MRSTVPHHLPSSRQGWACLEGQGCYRPGETDTSPTIRSSIRPARSAQPASAATRSSKTTTEDPKILAIPDAAWISQPAADDVELAA